MKANETKVEEFLSQNKTRFVIPVYQRNYDWTKYQCKKLLDDILDVGSSNEMNAHFIGSIVYIHDDIYTSSRIKELTIIDGQQRLTTLTLLYIALYKFAQDINDEELENEIHETYLINKYAPDNEKLKLKPTENNNEVLRYLLRNEGKEEYNDYSKLIENYSYIKERITKENINVILLGISKLMFVEISLDRNKDNPQRIFESLNSTGLELSQADLIRNYILMGLKHDKQQRIYRNYWLIIEKLAKDEYKNVSKVSDFIRDYLTLKNFKIPNKRKVYEEFQKKYPTGTINELESILDELKSLAKHYNKLVNPKNEKDKTIRRELEYINRLEINVTYPFLMKVYDDFYNEIITKDQFIDMLNFVQAYTFRRFIVGLPTNALNKIFMLLYDKIDENNYTDSLKKWLLERKGSQRFPRDKEVIDSLRLKDVYNIKSKNRIYLLERLENYDNKEFVKVLGNDDITIEHIFPQNPNPKWKIELGNEEFNSIKENYLHTIANLTLSGNNGKLGNKTFQQKRDLPKYGYKDSRLWLNKFLSEIDNWNQDKINERFVLLTDRFLKIWSFPNIEIKESDVYSETNIFEAEEPKHKKLEYIIFFDNKLPIKQVSKLYREVIIQLFDLQPELFFTTDIGESISLKKASFKHLLRQPMQITENYYVESNMDSVTKFNKIKKLLSTFELEDELIIKYAD